MIKLQGKAVNNSIAIGKAFILKDNSYEIKQKYIENENPKAEVETFKEAVDKAVSEIENLIENFAKSKSDVDILTTHKLILQDPEVHERIEHLIHEKNYTVEYAVDKHFKRNIKTFNNMDNEYFSKRALDFEDILKRLLGILKGENNSTLSSDIKQNSVVISEDITPTELLILHRKGIAGVCLSQGSLNSHSSIIARSLGIVTMVSVHNIFNKADEDDYLILNGEDNLVLINPDSATLNEFRNLLIKEEVELRRLQKFNDKDALSKDEIKINLFNNLEFPEEIEYIKHHKIDGIGLFRTEFLFIDRKDLPDEEEQFNSYKQILEDFAPMPVIFRTIDIGGDKLIESLNIAKEKNPNLGCRGIRLSLRNKNIFRHQIKALLRASVFGNLKIMLPMISSLEEVLLTKKMIEKFKKELDEEKIKYKDNIELGIMIEVPSAVFISDWLAQETDFFSLGTNDLVQYNLAVDRNSENVSEYYQPFMPSNILAIKQVIESARKHDINISICGEMASDIDFVKILLALGMKDFSIVPNKTLEMKDKISKISVSKLRGYESEILKLKTKDEVRNFVKNI